MNTKDNKKILITGCVGFIGMHLSRSLLDDGFIVHGIDNINDYYDIALKNSRLHILQRHKNFSFSKIDITNLDALKIIFKNFRPSKVVNLAAQAGVRYSVKNPHTYIDTNISGFMNILECCRYNSIDGLIYASSSSVYGGNEKIPFSEIDNVDNPVSIYAVSKKANELMAKTYAELYGLNSTGLRFFTVYGPWGRPDMAYYSFTEKILKNESIELYDNGEVERDFTYIADVVKGIKSALSKNYKYEIFNLGNSKCQKVLNLIRCIEKKLNKKATIVLKPMKLGDVKKTYANISKSEEMLDYNPRVNINTGIGYFLDWYKDYYKIK